MNMGGMACRPCLPTDPRADCSPCTGRATPRVSTAPLARLWLSANEGCFISRATPANDEVERKMSKPTPAQTSHRSSRSGQFVTEKYARQHPSTTERERIKHPERKK